MGCFSAEMLSKGKVEWHYRGDAGVWSQRYRAKGGPGRERWKDRTEKHTNTAKKGEGGTIEIDLKDKTTMENTTEKPAVAGEALNTLAAKNFQRPTAETTAMIGSDPDDYL